MRVKKTYNFILENIILPIGDIVNRSEFIIQLRKWREIVLLNENQLDILQKKNLLTVLEIATANVPYYRNLSIPKKADSVEWLKHFPILTKKIISENQASIINEKIPKKKLIRYASSGSSGIQGFNYINKREQSINRAIQVLWWEWAGYNIGDKIMQTGITPNRGLLKTIKDILFRTIYVPAFTHSEEKIKRDLSKVKKSKIVLAGYASSLYLFAEVAKKYDIQLNVKTAISWGDKLFEHYKSKISNVFNTKVYNTYGIGEGVMISAQKDLEYMYIMSPHVFLEIVDDKGNEVPEGTMGNVLVTRLDAFSMPLIRYKIGDLAIKLPRNQYPEKRQFKLPLLQMVIGRDTDIVETISGKFMNVHFFTGIFEFYPQIIQFTVLQESKSNITILYIPSSDFKLSILQEIKSKIHSYLNEEFPVDFQKVDVISPTPSGKPQIIQSKLRSQK